MSTTITYLESVLTSITLLLVDGRRPHLSTIHFTMSLASRHIGTSLRVIHSARAAASASRYLSSPSTSRLIRPPRTTVAPATLGAVRFYAQGPPGGGGGFPPGGFPHRGFPQQPQQQGPQKGDTLKQFSIDLTEMAKEGKLDPVIGRDDEIRRMIQVSVPRNRRTEFEHFC